MILLKISVSPARHFSSTAYHRFQPSPIFIELTMRVPLIIDA